MADSPNNSSTEKALLVRTGSQSPALGIIWLPSTIRTFFLRIPPIVRFLTCWLAAGYFLNWAWTVLDQEEYFVALVLVGMFVLLSFLSLYSWQIPMEQKWVSKGAKTVVGIVIVAVSLYSTAIVLQKRGNKPWSNLFPQEQLSPDANPQPTRIPTPIAPLQSTISPDRSVMSLPSGPEPKPAKKIPRKTRTGLDEEQRWILRQLNSNNNAHASQKSKRITKEEIKKTLVRKLSLKGLAFLVKQVQQRGVTFLLTPQIEKEIRDFGADHGNKSLNSIIAAIEESRDSLEAATKVPTARSLAQQDDGASLPKNLPGPSPRPSPRFGWFLNEFRAIHSGYNTYRVLCTSDITPCEYFAKLGRFSSNDVRLMLYVVRSWSVREVLLNVLDNYDRIVEDLKTKMKNEGMEILGLSVSRTIIVYIDIEAQLHLPVPWDEAKKKGLSFQIERSTA